MNPGLLQKQRAHRRIGKPMRLRLEVTRVEAGMTVDEVTALARDLAALIVSIIVAGEGASETQPEPSPTRNKTAAA